MVTPDVENMKTTEPEEVAESDVREPIRTDLHHTGTLVFFKDDWLQCYHWQWSCCGGSDVTNPEVVEHGEDRGCENIQHLTHNERYELCKRDERIRARMRASNRYHISFDDAESDQSYTTHPLGDVRVSDK